MEDELKKYCYYPAPFGELLLVEAFGKIEQVTFPIEHDLKTIKKEWVKNENTFKEIFIQLDEYFSGKRTKFSLELNPMGTVFQKAVWMELQKIPYGSTINYGELARRIGNPKASRAVGAANGKNPIGIIIPCHRVIGKDGSLTGFGGGLSVKELLLKLENS
ncbi:MAG: methylated-DNA--[protein]-cysteine S-methyltransferase [Deltaproteobacteria bacterium]|jgi:methylated-DNA-[protein]-cysteine S-methyltransferase|nr:methylated-DNA--[protein]-cysteine S-methyltransferase [Deltaproteobacteria bacterium]